MRSLGIQDEIIPEDCRDSVLGVSGTCFGWDSGRACDKESKAQYCSDFADDLGYSDLGCFGGEISTPRLDGLAASGLRMTQLYNAARCCSTRASLLTGLYPHQAGGGAMSADNHKPGYRGFLTKRAVCVATLLKDSGYRTYMSGKWHLRGKGNQACIPTNHGFEEFFGHFRAYASYYRRDLFERHPAGRATKDYADGEFMRLMRSRIMPLIF